MKKTPFAKPETGGRKRPPPLLSRAHLNKVAWYRAIEDWQYSKPEPLTALLRGKTPIPEDARGWLAQLALGQAKKKRGRRPAEFNMLAFVSETLKSVTITREFRQELALEKGLPRQRGGTPKERALATVAERHGMTDDELSQIVYPRRNGVDKSAK